MARELLSAIRPVVVSSLPLSPSQGDTVVLSSDGHLYTYNGSSWVDNGATGAGGGNRGTATLAFGSTPVEEASVAVTGQGAFALSSHARAWFQANDSTATNTTDDHEEAAARCPLVCRDFIAGTGFTIFANPMGLLGSGDFVVHWEWS